ncbi:MAG: hypothetical protein U5N10_03995 [Gemmobacter sp.]|nr:hypothetical protein [Gemmobacter sp.]
MAVGFAQVFAGLPLALYLLLCLLPARFAQIGLALGLLAVVALGVSYTLSGDPWGQVLAVLLAVALLLAVLAQVLRPWAGGRWPLLVLGLPLPLMLIAFLAFGA